MGPRPPLLRLHQDLSVLFSDRGFDAARGDLAVKHYILLHAKIDNMVELERAIKFYDANVKILNFSEKPGKGDHANPLLFKGNGKGEDGKGKGKKGKEKGKGKEAKKEDDKKDEKGKGKGKGKDNEGGDGKGKGGASGSANQPEKPKDPKKYDHIKCYKCNEYGHFSNKCPKPNKEKVTPGGSKAGFFLACTNWAVTSRLNISAKVALRENCASR